jgi:hypothetical protein
MRVKDLAPVPARGQFYEQLSAQLGINMLGRLTVAGELQGLLGDPSAKAASDIERDEYPHQWLEFGPGMFVHYGRDVGLFGLGELRTLASIVNPVDWYHTLVGAGSVLRNDGWVDGSWNIAGAALDGFWPFDKRDMYVAGQNSMNLSLLVAGALEKGAPPVGGKPVPGIAVYCGWQGMETGEVTLFRLDRDGTQLGRLEFGPLGKGQYPADWMEGTWLPHYHRRVEGPLPGQSLSGQGIGRHRPWEIKGTDTNWSDRF